MDEINACMIDAGADMATFKFKVLSPMFPFIESRLHDCDSFTQQDWDYAADMKDRREKLNDMALVWKEFRNFKNSRNFRQ